MLTVRLLFGAGQVTKCSAVGDKNHTFHRDLQKVIPTSRLDWRLVCVEFAVLRVFAYVFSISCKHAFLVQPSWSCTDGMEGCQRKKNNNLRLYNPKETLNLCWRSSKIKKKEKKNPPDHFNWRACVGWSVPLLLCGYLVREWKFKRRLRASTFINSDSCITMHVSFSHSDLTLHPNG